MNAVEELNLKVRGSLFTLTQEQLLEVCKLLTLENVQDKTTFVLITTIFKHLDSEKITAEADGGIGILGAIDDLITLINDPQATTTTSTNGNSTTTSTNSTTTSTHSTTTDTSTTPSVKEFQAALNVAAALHRKEFKIHGQIGKPGQQDKITFPSLARQIENGINKGYPPDEVVSAVIRAVGYGMPLRELLEGKQDLTLPRLRSILRSHFNEKDALSSYQELTVATQLPNETAQDYMIRLMNIRQRVLFTSQEDHSPVKYDASLVQNTFLLALQTGLDDSLKSEMKAYLENPMITDEALLEALNRAVNMEEKRALKRNVKVRVNEVNRATPSSSTNSSKIKEDISIQRNSDIAALAAGFADLKACVMALQEKADRPPSYRREKHPRRSTPRERGCQTCRDRGMGDRCSHCFKCGGHDHYARGCKGSQQQPSGNDYRAPRGDGM
jgi:hypothetical protein